jgi:hypothetical protein
LFESSSEQEAKLSASTPAIMNFEMVDINK